MVVIKSQDFGIEGVEDGEKGEGKNDWLHELN